MKEFAKNRSVISRRRVIVGALGLVVLASFIGLLIGLAPFIGLVKPSSAPGRAVNFHSGTYLTPGAVLRFERDRPWTCITRFAIKNPHKVNYGNVVFTNVGDPPYTGYELWIEPGAGKPRVKIMHSHNDGEMIQVTGSTNITDGKFHVVAASYDGSSTAAGVKIYVDGVKETTTTEYDYLNGTIVTGSSLFVIGNQIPPGHLFQLDGPMSFFALSTVVRDAAYIAAHATDDTRPGVDADTALYYDFTEGSGTILTDKSANALTGILTNYYGGTPPNWISLPPPRPPMPVSR